MRPSGRRYFFHVAQLAPRPRPAGSNFAPPNSSMNFCASDCSLKQYVKPLAAVIERVASRAERQVSTALVYLVGAAPVAEPRRKHDLLRPAAVNSRRRQFAFAPHARTAA